MSILTRFLIPSDSRKSRAALASPQVLHATILRAFGVEQHERFGQARVLWRLDPSLDQHRLYILSPEQPNLLHLANELGGDNTAGKVFDYSEFLESLKAETEWRFRLRANPTKSIRRAEGKSARQGVVKQAEQLEWLQSRSAGLGFHIPQNRLQQPEVIVTQSHSVEFRREGSTVTLATAVFDGILTVDDPAVFANTLTQGVGRAKGYGYGLLTLAPVGKS